MKLSDKVFIITGATSGMGKATSLLFAQQGAQLVVNGRNEERGHALIKELKAVTSDVTFLPGDVGNPEVNKQLVELATSTYGRLSGVVTNAGVLGLGNLTDISIESWSDTININLNSFFYLCKYAIPAIQSENGVIIANASIAAYKSFPNHPAYCASKAALVALVKQAALDYGPEVRINAICPGPVDTPLIHDSAKAFEDPDMVIENVRKSTPLRRLGTPEDFAKLALFLASEDASWMTGSAVTLDGGVMVTS